MIDIHVSIRNKCEQFEVSKHSSFLPMASWSVAISGMILDTTKVAIAGARELVHGFNILANKTSELKLVPH